MRRCFTPNPHTKTKMLSDLVGFQTPTKTHSLQIDYDSFIFVDRVTNHKICVGDAKNKYGGKPKKNNTFTKNQKKPVSSRGKAFEQNREIDEINECWNFMKTTKLFQMDSLKSKIFSKNSQCENKENSGYDDMHKKKKNLREFIEKYIHEINIKEFRNYVNYDEEDRKKYFNQRVINLWKHVPSKFNRQNIGKIIEQILESEEKIEKKPIGDYLSIQDIKFPDEQRMQTILLNHAFVKNRQFEYLVHPFSEHDVKKKKVPLKSTSTKKKGQFQYKSGISDLKFKEGSYEIDMKKNQNMRNNWVDENKVYISKSLKAKEKNLVIAVQNGLIYDLLFLLIRWPVLIHTVDKKGNNLLHMAAKKNQLDVFDILMKKMSIDCLSKKNSHGKTPIQIAKIFNSVDIMKRTKQYEDYL